MDFTPTHRWTLKARPAGYKGKGCVKIKGRNKKVPGVVHVQFKDGRTFLVDARGLEKISA